MLPQGIFVLGQGPAIVFLHSSLSSSRQWSSLIKILARNHTCINVDMLGYGDADKVVDPSNYNFDVEAKRINYAIEQIIGQKKYHLIGHSCGGAVALKIAVEAPERLLSMSLFEPVAFHLLPQGGQEKTLVDQFAAKVAIKNSVNAAEVFIDFWNQAGFFAALPEKVKVLMANDMPKVNLDFIGLTSEKYRLEDVANIKAPCQILTGKFSPNLSHYVAKKLITALPNCLHNEVLAGHMAPVSHEKLVFPLIAAFIGKQY